MSGPYAPLFSTAYFQDPFPTFAWLRENSPVHELSFPVGDVPALLVSRHADVKQVMGNNTFSTRQAAWSNAAFRAAGLVIGDGGVFEKSITLSDPPDHTRIRRVVMPYFVPSRVASWRLLVQEKVAERLRGFEGEERIDVIEDFAGAIPMEVISAVLGFSLDAHLGIVDAVERAFPADPSASDASPNVFDEICDLSRALVLDKERSPAEDLTSFLVHAWRTEESLSLDELVALVAVIILGGIDTTRALIGNAVLALLDHPEQRELLRSHPALDAQAVEEFLRHSGSVVVPVIRFPVRDTEIAGVPVAAGTPVLPCVMSANRDPASVTAPDRLDVARTSVKHFGLGHGIHSCLGAALARLEAEVAIPALIRSYPGMRLAVPRDGLAYVNSWTLRGLTSLPVEPGGRQP
ncbi:cytochrome P450 [Streptomyces sp. NPDC058701]|uniref:cytochrome P450 n=1 Tax=Streptomyces sp. NPDC058701 TaxID=3346608 RepID=UPI003659067E